MTAEQMRAFRAAVHQYRGGRRDLLFLVIAMRAFGLVPDPAKGETRFRDAEKRLEAAIVRWSEARQ